MVVAGSLVIEAEPRLERLLSNRWQRQREVNAFDAAPRQPLVLKQIGHIGHKPSFNVTTGIGPAPSHQLEARPVWIGALPAPAHVNALWLQAASGLKLRYHCDLH